MEARAGNITRALKHFMIAAEYRETESLDKIRKFYSNGHATKHDYTKALKYRQAYVSEVKSNQREAAALNEGYYYYSALEIFITESMQICGGRQQLD